MSNHIDSTEFIDNWVQPLFGLPCWGLNYGRQTNLSINFGQPSLHMREPYASESESQVVQQLAAQRLVTVRGEWWLWLRCCYWQLTLKDEAIATGSSSIRKIDEAMSQLTGQKLVAVTVNERTGFTRFEFDLGCELNCRRFDRNSEGELWNLYRPNGYVLTVHGDGRACHQCETDS